MLQAQKVDQCKIVVSFQDSHKMSLKKNLLEYMSGFVTGWVASTKPFKTFKVRQNGRITIKMTMFPECT